jgi:hypothetical protein
MDMSQEGKGNMAVPLSEKKDAATAACMAMNKETEDSNAFVHGSSAAVVCNFSYILYFLSMRVVHKHCYIDRWARGRAQTDVLSGEELWVRSYP